MTAHADLLAAAYEALDLHGGALLTTTEDPGGQPEWQTVGEWLMLARRMGAERVFFVGDEPVVLFARLPDGANTAAILDAYRRAWSLARPQCLFLATEDELRVFALARPPVSPADVGQAIEPLVVVSSAADVAVALSSYHRERIECGTTFEAPEYGNQTGRAEYRLLRDVRTVTELLEQAGLDRSVAHSMVQRAILIRYLEDRGVVTPDYFEAIAVANSRWQRTLAGLDDDRRSFGARSAFANVLKDMEFCRAVFAALERDFNGDMFTVSAEEVSQTTDRHLTLLYRLLTGAGLSNQEPLFLWAYDFSVVPASLISSMYEQFYRSTTEGDAGTHYTPPELVEFVLGQTLNDEVLSEWPRVCDLACGSGIFLVEAFRRVVRYESQRLGRRLDTAELRELLLTRLGGVDLNREAVRLAAFSLYLAYLNYQSPSDIRLAGPLPKLVYDGRGASSVLVVGDAFWESTQHVGGEMNLPWSERSFDVIVGNPPWDEPRDGARRVSENWAKQRALPIGERSPSHLFMWRALSLLKPSGIAALLVGATAFHNARPTTQRFRQAWLSAVRLEMVVDFSQARHLFFSDAIAPFLLVRFRPARESGVDRSTVLYRTVRPSAALVNTRSLGYARLDRKWVSQASLGARPYLWKVYAWGNHHDDAFMARLDAEKRLGDFLPSADAPPAYGYQRGPTPPSEYLASLRSLRTFEIDGPLLEGWFEPSAAGTKRQPDERIYAGQRLLVSRGIKVGFGPRVRLTTEPIAFRHNVYAIPLAKLPKWQAVTMLAVLLSSLGRYRMFMTSGSWGLWHDSVVPDDILGVPMRMPGARSELYKSLGKVIDRIQRSTFAQQSLLDEASGEDGGAVLRELDELVFDLFELTKAERQLVTDFHHYSLPSAGGRTRDLASVPVDRLWLARDLLDLPSPMSTYVSTFVEGWGRELEPSAELRWRVVSSPRSGLVAAVFEPWPKGASGEVLLAGAPEAWDLVLRRLARDLDRPLATTVRTEGSLRAVSDSAIVVIKSSEARRWTGTAARDDMEATLLQAMALRTS